MATCKECVCNELCTTIGFNNGFKGGEQCRHFKDKSRFVELPCEVGDVLYEISERRKNDKWQKVIVKRVVHGIEYGVSGILTARCSRNSLVFLSGLGKTVFFTREEAKRVLKEREQE